VSAFLSVVRAELFKVLRKRRFYMLAALLWLVLPALMLLAGRLLEANVRGSFVDDAEIVANVVQQLASPFGLARAALTGPALLSPTFYIIAIALFAGALMGEEQSHRMWKSVLTSQPSRAAVLAGKLAVAMILTGLLLAGGLLAGLGLGSVGMLFLDTHSGGAWWDLARLYLLQWLFSASATLFAFLMILLTRHVSLGMVLIFFLPPLSEGLYAIFRATSRIQPLTRLNALFQALELRGTLESLPRYFFSSNLYAPARRPLTELTSLFAAAQDDDLVPFFASLLRNDVGLLHSGLVMLGYGAFFLALLTWVFLRRDVD
jgi:ABC-type transport system involved in multi-copper enzyme maturation permease subunit